MGPAAGPSAWRSGLGRAARATSLRGRERDLAHASGTPGTSPRDWGGQGRAAGSGETTAWQMPSESRWLSERAQVMFSSSFTSSYLKHKRLDISSDPREFCPCSPQTRALQITSLNTNSESFSPPLATPPQLPQEALLGVNPYEQADSHFIRVFYLSYCWKTELGFKISSSTSLGFHVSLPCATYSLLLNVVIFFPFHLGSCTVIMKRGRMVTFNREVREV